MFGLMRLNMAEVRENLGDQLGYFKAAYDKAVAELGGPAVQEILLVVHRAYLHGPEKFALTWSKFLKLADKEGVELSFPH